MAGKGKKRSIQVWGCDLEDGTKIIYATFFVLSLFMMSIGVSGIIEHKSPENLSSLLTLSTGFIAYFKYHTLIILGGLCLTISVYFIRKNPQ